MTATGFHHVAYACRDIEQTVRFYEDLMGFPLVHTEVKGATLPDGTKSWMRHIFFDCGAGEAIAFFEVNNVGEQPDWRADVSTGNGLPVWVNHCAFGATAEQQEAARARMSAAAIEPLMEIDHGWCHSLYYLDPNGIMVELCRDTPGTPNDPAEAQRLVAAVPLSE